jgi:hypothetical protein
MAVAYLAGRFEPGREYSEREVNELLLDWHTFGDWALLRRRLCDWRHMERERDGTRYPAAAWSHRDGSLTPPRRARAASGADPRHRGCAAKGASTRGWRRRAPPR